MFRTKVPFVCLSLLAIGAWLAADVKYTQEMQMAQGMPAMRTTVYVKGQQIERRDTEMPMMGNISTITNCAKRQVITVNWKCKLYHVAPLDPDNPPQPASMPTAAPQGVREPARRGGLVVVQNEIRDTGERQQMFGHTARHVISKMKMEAKEGACMQGGMEIENDQWLVDVALAEVACTPKMGERPPPVPVASGGCRDRYQMVNKGNPAAMRGVPVKSTMTTIGQDGRRQSFTTELKDLSTATLEGSLFEPPADFKQASSSDELYRCGMGLGNVAEMMKEAERQAQAQQSAQTSAARRSGEIPIGVVLTDRSRRVDAATLNTTLVQKIDAIEGFVGVRIEARDPDGIQKEAIEKKCQFVLYADVAEMKSSGPRVGGLLGRAAGIGGSLDATHNMRMDYRLATVEPWDTQVAKEALAHTEKAPAVEQATDTFMERTAERATGDARRWRIQQRK